jgi:hypothetical protein
MDLIVENILVLQLLLLRAQRILSLLLSEFELLDSPLEVLVLHLQDL